MLLALFGTFITAFANVFWTKSLKYGLRPIAHNLASYPMGLALLGYFIYAGVDTSKLDLLFVVAIIIIISLNLIRQPIRQKIYREEKMSLIMPYTNLNKIFVIILSFFLFQDVSFITFWIIIFTIVVIAFSSIDFKNKKVPRNLDKILLDEVIVTLDILISGWMVITYGNILYFNGYVVVGLLMHIVAIFVAGQIKDIQNAPIGYWKIRPIGALGWVAWFLSLVVIQSLGLSLSILLGFLGIGVTLVVSYIFLQDTPSKKNLLLTITVSLLIGIGYYFK